MSAPDEGCRTNDSLGLAGGDGTVCARTPLENEVEDDGVIEEEAPLMFCPNGAAAAGGVPTKLEADDAPRRWL